MLNIVTGWLVDSGCKKARTYFFFGNKKKNPKKTGGLSRDRAHDLAIRSQALYQLRYTEVGLEVGWLFWLHKTYHGEVCHFF